VAGGREEVGGGWRGRTDGGPTRGGGGGERGGTVGVDGEGGEGGVRACLLS
jgi:hypothetical protein